MTKKTPDFQNEVKIFQLQYELDYPFTIDKNEEWASELFSEYSLEVPSHMSSYVSGDLLITKEHHHEWKDFLIIKGKVFGSYNASCSRCLIPTCIEFQHELQMACLDEKNLENPELEEQLELYYKDSIYEIFFADLARSLKLRSILDEKILLETSSFPLHDKDCKGLCQCCGVNLNDQACKNLKGR